MYQLRAYIASYVQSISIVMPIQTTYCVFLLQSMISYSCIVLEAWPLSRLGNHVISRMTQIADFNRSSSLHPHFFHCYTASAMEDNHPLKHVSPQILSLLSHLHAQSSTQESQLTPADYALETIDSTMRDKFIALEQDKCYFIYQLAISINAKTIVEAGTSYGLSTIYLALAVASNVEASGGLRQGHRDRTRA